MEAKLIRNLKTVKHLIVMQPTQKMCWVKSIYYKDAVKIYFEAARHPFASVCGTKLTVFATL